MYSICSKTCFIAFIFLVGMIYMTFSIDKCEISDSFVDSLNDAQLEQYRLIVKERRNLYIQGFLLGLALSAIYVYYKKIDDKENKENDINIMCMIAIIIFLTSYFYYILSKKPKLIVIHLDKQKQRELWTRVYRKMQFNYHFGLFLGIIGACILSKAVCFT